MLKDTCLKRGTSIDFLKIPVVFWVVFPPLPRYINRGRETFPNYLYIERNHLHSNI